MIRASVPLFQTDDVLRTRRVVCSGSRSVVTHAGFSENMRQQRLPECISVFTVDLTLYPPSPPLASNILF